MEFIKSYYRICGDREVNIAKLVISNDNCSTLQNELDNLLLSYSIKKEKYDYIYDKINILII